MKEEVGSRAARAVARHPRFAAIRIENADDEVGRVIPSVLNYRDAVTAGAVVPVTNSASKASQVGDLSQLFSFEDKIVVAVALEFGELNVHFKVPRRFSDCWLLFEHPP